MLVVGVAAPAAAQLEVSIDLPLLDTQESSAAPDQAPSAGEVPLDPADLRISKSDDEDPVAVGDTITYTIVVTNDGPDDAENVELVDTLPAGVTFLSASDGCDESAGVVTCSLGKIKSTKSKTIEIVVRADVADDQTNTATVSSDTPDPDPSDNTDSETTNVRTEAPENLSCEVVEDGVHLEWDAVDQAVTYDVYRRVAGDGGFVFLGSTSSTEFDDTSVAPGTAYEYVITSDSGSGESDPSDPCVTSAVPLLGGILATGVALAGSLGAYAWMRRRKGAG